MFRHRIAPALAVFLMAAPALGSETRSSNSLPASPPKPTASAALVQAVVTAGSTPSCDAPGNAYGHDKDKAKGLAVGHCHANTAG